MALAGGPEVLGFRVPAESGQALLVWGLEEGAEHSLFSAFSEFGLLYSVRVHRNAAVAGPGYYALVKFYSARDASRAQRACHRQRLFQKSPLKVCICTRQKTFKQQVLALRSYKCKELANYYLGFNGWSNRIIMIKLAPWMDPMPSLWLPSLTAISNSSTSCTVTWILKHRF
ncbi:RAD52 motif-containing protein 1 isoform X2 [Eretmochelys imbricata]